MCILGFWNFNKRGIQNLFFQSCKRISFVQGTDTFWKVGGIINTVIISTKVNIIFSCLKMIINTDGLGEAKLQFNHIINSFYLSNSSECLWNNVVKKERLLSLCAFLLSYGCKQLCVLVDVPSYLSSCSEEVSWNRL